MRSVVRYASVLSIAFICGVPTLAGCGSGGTSGPETNPVQDTAPQPAASQGYPVPLDSDGKPEIQRTVVKLNADGTKSVKKVWVTRARSQAEQAMRRAMQRPDVKATGDVSRFAPDISQDDSCAGASLWLFTDSSCSESAEYWSELCFSGSGTAYLDDYTFCDVSPKYFCDYPYGDLPWSDNVVSYWPGTEYGYIYGEDGDLGGDVDFSAGQVCTNSSSYASYAISVTLSD